MTVRPVFLKEAMEMHIKKRLAMCKNVEEELAYMN